MNSKQFMDFLKNLQKIKCPSCGQAYKVEEIQFLGQVDGLFLLQMVCGGCDLLVSMNFMTTKSMSKSGIIMSERSSEELLKVNGQISADEIIEFHQFLNEFEGDFRKLK